MERKLVVVGGVADDPFAIDVAHFLGQEEEISDIVSYKRFANKEFCPRFISDESDLEHIGSGLAGTSIVILSTWSGEHTRNAQAMRTCLLARAAKDNGAESVLLIEPDLFYSAQDRGPQECHGDVAFERNTEDYKKFDGQPFSSRLYAQLLHTSGVDGVITIHNHSVSVQRLFAREFNGRFWNLSPADLYAHYLTRNEILNPRGESAGLVVCAPDKGAAPFVTEIHAALVSSTSKLLVKTVPELLLMDKVRKGERKVSMEAWENSPVQLSDLRGKDVVVFDDMVRTGSTVTKCCRIIKSAGARRVLFVVTHFYSSPEAKENLNDPSIDEIITTNTLPNILNRDMQGRLRKKMLVLKIEKWLANFCRKEFLKEESQMHQPPYSVDISSKNPRWFERQAEK